MRDKLHGIRAVQTLMDINGMIEGEDGVKGQGAVFQTIVNRSVFLGMPGVVDGDNHIYRAAAKVSSILKHMSGVLSHDQSADIGKPKDLVERERHKVRCREWIGQIQSGGTRQCCSIEQGVCGSFVE